MSENLYLIRHAEAEDLGEAYPNDSLRPLTNKGHGQAQNLSKALKVLNINFDRLFSSPYLRALETAQLLSNCLREGKEIILENLTKANYSDLLADLHSYSKEQDTHLALVGHEPYLSEFAAYMLTSDVQGVNIAFKKGALVQIYGELNVGGMLLKAMLPTSISKAIAIR